MITNIINSLLKSAGTEQNTAADFNSPEIVTGPEAAPECQNSSQSSNSSRSARKSQRDKKKDKRPPSPHWTDIWPTLSGPDRIKNREKARKIL